VANLAPDDRARAEQVFVCDMGARTTTLISFSGDGKGNDDSQSLSLIGRWPPGRLRLIRDQPRSSPPGAFSLDGRPAALRVL